jgi:hypothetical protein
MTRVALSIFAFFAYIALVFAAPVPVVDGELVQLERRITHTGRVRALRVAVFLKPRLTFANYINRVLGSILVSGAVVVSDRKIPNSIFVV